MTNISSEKIAIICIGCVIAVLLLIIVAILVIRMTGQVVRLEKKESRPRSVISIPRSIEVARRLSSGSRSSSSRRSQPACERSNSIYFQPTIAKNDAENSRVLIVTEDDISNYTNRYDIVLLKTFNGTLSASMAELNGSIKEAQPARKARRSLPARYIDV